MNTQSVSSHGRCWLALSGVLFVLFFLAGDVIRANVATVSLPMPRAPAGDVVRYYASSGTAALFVEVVQLLSATALFVFGGYVAFVVRRVQGDASTLPVVTRGASALAAAFLLVCALLGLALIPVSAGSDLGLVGTLRTLNFLSGGTFHVAALGIFVGAASLAARNANVLPRWIIWWGIVQAVVSVLSLL